MTKRLRSLLTVPVAAFLLVSAGALERVAAQAPVEETISDERVMELARGYAELLLAGEYEKLWEHVSPQARERFGTVERFRGGGESAMNALGMETLLVSETVEPARVGMIAHKLYHRVSHYAGREGTPMRLTIGLVKDGSIGGITARPAQ